MAATTPKIELIYDPDCPNVERAREWLSHAVAGRDVAADHPQGSACRLYDQGDGTLDPSPPVAAILTALRKRSPSQARRSN